MTAVQDFSIPLGDDQNVTFAIDPSVDIPLAGATVTWEAYAMAYAVPDPTQPLISKSSASGGVSIIVSPEQFTVHLVAADTEPLFCGNYYHEAEIVDASGSHVTAIQGAMTVTLAVIP
jgi:hypothetical protein